MSLGAMTSNLSKSSPDGKDLARGQRRGVICNA